MPKPRTSTGYMKDTEEGDVSETTTDAQAETEDAKDDRSDAVKQALKQASSPTVKHNAYKADLERLHEESQIDPATGKTRYFG